MPAAEPVPSRPLWLVVWGALTAAPVIYSALAPQLARPEPAEIFPTMRAVLVAVAAACFALGAFVMSRAGRPGGWPPAPPGTASAGDLAAPQVFQLRSIVAMALFECSSVFGFVLVGLGMSALEILPWAAATVVGMLAIVLPNGLAYWRRWEMEGAGSGGLRTR